MKNTSKSPYIWTVLGYILALFFLADLIMRLIYLTGFQLNSNHYNNYQEFVNKEIQLGYYVSFLNQILFIIAVWILFFKTKWFGKRKIDFRIKDILYSIYGFLIKILISIIMGIAFNLLGMEFTSVAPNQERLEDFLQAYLILGGIFSIVLAPIIEEFIFRKVIIGHIFKNHKYIGLVVSSILFGSLHLLAGFSVPGLIIYVSLGFILGWIYIKTERIEASITAHTFNNFISVVLSQSLK
ncbi:CPBP family intramembrane glutamic endopeptidase [Priestia filamentosa]|uniref:CPBP family intramembrane glutamic endopeptidase n=1 Tax=Priestia filamentosa TaxID=1402861 RepID=UPI003981FB46